MIKEGDTGMSRKAAIVRGDVFYADLGENKGSVQGGERPVVIIQNDIGNRKSTTVIIAAITSAQKNKMPTHVKLNSEFLEKESIVLLEQIRTLNKYDLREKIGELSFKEIRAIDKAIRVSLDLVS